MTRCSSSQPDHAHSSSFSRRRSSLSSSPCYISTAGFANESMPALRRDHNKHSSTFDRMYECVTIGYGCVTMGELSLSCDESACHILLKRCATLCCYGRNLWLLSISHSLPAVRCDFVCCWQVTHLQLLEQLRWSGSSPLQLLRSELCPCRWWFIQLWKHHQSCCNMYSIKASAILPHQLLKNIHMVCSSDVLQQLHVILGWGAVWVLLYLRYVCMAGDWHCCRGFCGLHTTQQHRSPAASTDLHSVTAADNNSCVAFGKVAKQQSA